jgi:hypothetical protein
LPNPPQPQTVETTRLIRRHMVIGWSGLLVFLTLGIVLETLHGFKASAYLDTRNTTRRLMWTLAHTHGTLFSLVNIVFALSLARLGMTSDKRLRLVSFAFTGALGLMPLGFFLGGLKTYGGDPGPGILLVPIGAVLLLAGVGAFTLDAIRNRGVAHKDGESGRPFSASPQVVLPGKEKGDSAASKKSPRR